MVTNVNVNVNMNVNMTTNSMIKLGDLTQSCIGTTVTRIACQVVKLQLDKLGFDSEFLQCQIQVNDDKVWEGIRRKYWHNRDVYYLPKVTWNQEFLGRKTKAEADQSDMEVESEGQTKRQRRMNG